MKVNILAVDDDPMNLLATKGLLQSWGYAVDTAERPSDALKLVQGSKEYAVILLDYLMPEMTGSVLAEQIRKINEEAVILIYSCEDSKEAVIECFRAQAVNFIPKDEDIPKLRRAIEDGVKRHENLKTLKLGYAPEDGSSLLSEMGLIGAAPSMMKVAALAKRFRIMDDPVLITGETGTGKELIAKALHDSSKGGFFVVNCAAFANSSLVEAELFGYEKGAFTGAINKKAGILEVANRGTVFLDELHHLSEAAQAGLLRAIREKKIRRVGADRETDIHCRIVAATKPDIHEKAKTNDFLQDLYFRLKVLLIEIPTLRERKEDIPLLVQHFCNEFNRKNGTSKRFLARTVRSFEEFSWPGNIGELRGLVVNLLASTNKNTIEPRDLDSRFEQPLEEGEIAGLTLETFDAKQRREKLKFLESVINSSESQRHAAKRLGVKESTLRGQLERVRS